MGLYRLGLYLLLCSHSLFAATYWSHMPGFGSVLLTELNPEQHTVLQQHLELNSVDTELWLDSLPGQLDVLSCNTVDVQSQPLPAYVDASYQVVSYGGVLKFSTNDKSKKTVWWLPWSLLPLLSQLRAEISNPAVHTHQPLLITEHDLNQKGQFIVVSGSQNLQYFALKLNTIHLPELLWSASSAEPGFSELKGANAQPVLMAEHSSGPAGTSLSLFLPNTATVGQTPLFYRVDALTGAVQTKLITEQKISALSGALALYDQNRDSMADSLIFSTTAGQVWQAQMDGKQFYNIQLVADLSGLQLSDIQFIRTLYAAVPVGGTGSDFHSRRSQWLVLLSALKHQQSIFIVLKRQDGPAPRISDFVNRTLPDTSGPAMLTDQLWQQIQLADGWYSLLSGRLSHSPVVAAGVVYLTLLNTDSEQFCNLENTTSALLALHLHHASPVYRQQVLALDKAAGALAVTANADGGFALIEQHHKQVLIENMLEISPDCIHCSKIMQQDSFPRWQLMGTYHSEEGAYE